MTPETDALNTARSDFNLAFTAQNWSKVAAICREVERLAELAESEKSCDESGTVSDWPLIKPLPLLSETGYRLGQEN